MPPRSWNRLGAEAAPRALLLALTLFAVSAVIGIAPGGAAGELDAACSVPAAIPGDGRDDRVAIQNALTSQGCAHLPAGVYDIDSIPVPPSPARRPPMMLDASGAELRGDGAGTLLAFRGSTGGQDWEGIRLAGAGSKLQDLSITTGAITETAEQTHAVRLLGPAIDAEVSRVSFNHPIRVGKSGDCVQIVGFTDGREIARVAIRDNDFLHCDRSGVAVHSGTTNLEIVGNRFGDVGNSDLDFEGTGDTSDVLIRGNRFTMSPGPHGVGAIQLQLVERARVTDNVLDGRGIDVFQSDDVEIDHNEITLTQTTATPAIAVTKDSARTRILGNSITRVPSAGPGAVIAARPHNSGTPDHLEIGGNTLLQQTSFNVVTGSGLVGLRVRDNTIAYEGPVVDVMWGVLALGSAGTAGIRTTDVRVEGNTFSGPLRAAVSTSGSNFGAGTLDTSDNVATGVTHGIFCDNFDSQGKVLGPITSTGDSWPPPLCGPEGFIKPRPTTPPVPEDGPVDGGGTPPGSDPTPPGAGLVPSSTDLTPPVLSDVSLSRGSFRVANAATAIAARARPGTVLRFASSEAGTLSIRIERAPRGSRVRSHVATLTRSIEAGPGRVALSGRIGARPMKPGAYRLTLAIRDPAGNSSKPTVRTVTILSDRPLPAPPPAGSRLADVGGLPRAGALRPETTLAKHPPKRTSSRTARFTFSSDQFAPRFECKLDHRAFRPCASPFEEKVRAGSHVFQVRATDGAGEADLSPAIFRWRVY
jgi:Right handed beta helix region